MSEVLPSRKTLFQQDVAYRRSVSEAILTKVAGQNNFINSYQVDCKEFKLNGSYNLATGLDFYDGVTSFFFNSEIVGIYFYNSKAGSSRVSDFDLIWIDASGVEQGSIFSTTPKIDTTAADNAVCFKNLVTSTEVTPTGCVQPVFSKTTFFEGESIFLRMNDTMTSCNNGGLTFYFRPINQEDV
jgi:hypothetical protein